MSETKKFTNREIIRFVRAADAYQAARDGGKLKPAPKLDYAVSRVRPKAQRVSERYVEGLEDIEMDLCLTENEEDKNSAIRRDAQGNLCFSRDGMKAMAARKRELADELVEVEVYIATQVPDDLAPGFREAFEGFVIPVTEEPQGDEEEAALGVGA